MSLISLGCPDYWDERYKEEEKRMTTRFTLFDWYAPFENLYPTVETVIDTQLNHKVLVVGVGRSSMVDVLYSKGFKDITAIDISQTVIRQMQQKYENYPGVEFLTMDVRDMSGIPDQTYSFVMDKGCLDAIFCQGDYNDSIKAMLKEIYRVMKDGGKFCSVSCANARSRVPYLRCVPCALDVLPLPDGEGLSLFVLNRTSDPMLLGKKIVGAEAAVREVREKRVITSLEQKMNKIGTFRSKGFSGSLTVTATDTALSDMVAESAEVDG